MHQKFPLLLSKLSNDDCLQERNSRKVSIESIVNKLLLLDKLANVKNL